MTDESGRSHKVRAIRAAIRMAEAACPDEPPSPGRTLGIEACDECPFAVLHFKAAIGCRFAAWPRAGFRDISFVAGRPTPPPGWCPLRAGPVTVEVRI